MQLHGRTHEEADEQAHMQQTVADKRSQHCAIVDLWRQLWQLRMMSVCTLALSAFMPRTVRLSHSSDLLMCFACNPVDAAALLTVAAAVLRPLVKPFISPGLQMSLIRICCIIMPCRRSKNVCNVARSSTAPFNSVCHGVASLRLTYALNTVLTALRWPSDDAVAGGDCWHLAWLGLHTPGNEHRHTVACVACGAR